MGHRISFMSFVGAFYSSLKLDRCASAVGFQGAEISVTYRRVSIGVLFMVMCDIQITVGRPGISGVCDTCHA